MQPGEDAEANAERVKGDGSGRLWRLIEGRARAILCMVGSERVGYERMCAMLSVWETGVESATVERGIVSVQTKCAL